MATGQRVAIVGVGYSQVGRRSGLTADQHMIQATKSALDDAGLTVHDIDGVTSVGSEPLNDAWLLGIEPVNWWASGMMAPAFSYSAVQAIAAVASGFCHTALALRVIQQQPSSSALVKGAGAKHPMTSMLHAAGGDRQFLTPFGAGSPVQWAGLFTQRYMSQYGATEEDFGRHVITQRYHASMNDDAIFHEPMTLDDYLSARYVSKPLRILDCDYPVDSGSAVIFTTEERARDLDQPVVLVDSYALTAIRDLNFEIMSDMVHTAPAQTAKSLWERTDLTPADVDTAQLYDGFSIIVFQWLEALGFCGEGEAGAFIAEGNTRLGGSLPVNTDGGACNVGRRHGANFCIEATRQLRGQCGERQVDDAEVAVWTNAVGPFAAGAILKKG
jgi:acetyl-CoA acetyltransferase